MQSDGNLFPLFLALGAGVALVFALLLPVRWFLGWFLKTDEVLALLRDIRALLTLLAEVRDQLAQDRGEAVKPSPPERSSVPGPQ